MTFNITGGGICLSSFNGIIDSCEIIDNRAWKTAGLKSFSGNFIINNSLISRNISQAEFLSGAGIAQLGGIIKIENTEITYNKILLRSDDCGGGIGQSSGIMTLKNVKLIGNSAIVDRFGGGAIFANGHIILDNVIVYKNSGKFAVYFYADSQPKIYNSVISNNHVVESAIYGNAAYSPLYISNSTVSNNTHIGVLADYANISHCTITNNHKAIVIESSFIQSKIDSNNIIGNGVGVNNLDDTQMLDCKNNFWGDNSGPYQSTFNPNGLGDSVGFWANPIPFLTNPNTLAPVPPVQGFKITNIFHNSIEVKWEQSMISDLSGYILYFDSDSSGYPYNNSVDVGLDTVYTLLNLDSSKTYYLSVVAYDNNNNKSWFSNEHTVNLTTLAVKKDNEINRFQLYQNYPNPFNPTTTISYSLPKRGFVNLTVYDILGREVANLVNKEQATGNYKVEFNASNLSSGVYFYRLHCGDFVETKKLILLR